MNQAEIEEKEKELRKKFPKSFSHSEARPGEVCLGLTPFMLQCAALRMNGLKTVRMVKSKVKIEVQVSIGGGPDHPEQVEGWMLFADAKEFIKYNYGR